MIGSEPQTVKISSKSTISILGFQVLFYGTIFALLYWIVTFNWKMLLLSAIVSFLQTFVPGRNQKYINFVLDYLKPQQYFAVERHYEEPVPAQEKTMFCFHPHSIFSYGVLCNANNKNYPGEKLTHATILGSRFMLFLPIIGLHFRFWGLESVDPHHLKMLMKRGESISLVPGGYEEATITTPKQLRVFIKSRKGFIKYALKYGYSLRPVIITNEHKAMNTFDGLLGLRLLFNKIKLPGTVFWCRYGLFFPPGIKMHTLIGRGIRSARTYASNEEPTKKQIEEAHAEYIDHIKELYSKHESKNGHTPIVFF